METPWGPLGYITFARTYARRLKEDDPNSDLETFEMSVDRIVKACRKQLKINFSPEDEVRLRKHLIELKFSVAGRFLWQLGTKTVDKLGLLSLQNCAFTTVNHPVEPFCWTMDALMLGSGVGYNIQKEFVYELPKPKKVKITRQDTNDADFIVPDSREGWVALLRKVLEAHYYTGEGFTYSTVCVRGKGSPIKGFGGVASGPEELCWGMTEINKILNNRAGKKVRPIDCLDIMNIIGFLVVAGNIRRCLPEGALVHTERGLIPIEKIEPGKDMALTTDGYKRVLNKFENGKVKLLKIKTEDGYFECTPSHKMAVMVSGDGSYIWKEAQHLTPGDRLITTRKSITGEKTSLPEWSYEYSKKSTTCKEIIVPELDEDVAWLIGLFQADGYTFTNYDNNGFNSYISIIFGIDEVEMAEKARNILQRFGKDLYITVKKRKKENSILLHCQSKQLAWYFGKYVKQARTPLNVPEFILRARREIKLAYVAGVLDGDGCVKNRPIKILSTVYGDFAKEIQTLLYSCGIETRLDILEKNRPSREGWQLIHGLNLITSKSKKEVASIPNLMKKFKNYSNSSKANGIPSEWIKDGKIIRKYGLRQAKQMNIDSYEKEYGPIDYIPVAVTEVFMTEKEALTWDIEVEEKHEFFCNGYLTHNSASIAIGDFDDIQFLRAKRWDLGDIPNWRSMSNNSVVCNDISLLPDEFWEGYKGNGEPYGLINLKLAKSIGRLGDFDRVDPDIAGVNPCGEQTLAPYETCCLGEVFLPNIQSKEEFLEVLKFSYIICKHSLALPCHLKKTEEIVHKNMRMGIGITGQCQASQEQLSWLADGYNFLREFDAKYSKEHGFNESIKITTVKPSGTLSLLAGVTPGCHPGFSQYFIRRIRIASNSSLIKVCKDHGYYMEYQKNFDGSEDKNTLVVDFPCSYPEGTLLAKDMTAIQQLENIKWLQQNWSDNSVSCTVYYRKEELPQIKQWLAENYNNSVKTCSFLLHQDHGFVQAPFEEITKDKYLELIQKVKPINSCDVKENDFQLEECAGGACPIK